jgi:hypothetical protein
VDQRAGTGRDRHRCRPRAARRPLFAIGAAFMTPPADAAASPVPSETTNRRLSPDNLASPRSPVETG